MRSTGTISQRNVSRARSQKRSIVMPTTIASTSSSSSRPAKILGNLRKAFHAEVADKIVGEIAKELTSHPIPQIEKLFAA